MLILASRKQLLPLGKNLFFARADFTGVNHHVEKNSTTVGLGLTVRIVVWRTSMVIRAWVSVTVRILDVYYV